MQALIEHIGAIKLQLGALAGMADMGFKPGEFCAETERRLVELGARRQINQARHDQRRIRGRMLLYHTIQLGARHHDDNQRQIGEAVRFHRIAFNELGLHAFRH